MTLSREEALQMIYTGIAEINTERAAKTKSQLTLAPETKLLGGGEVDSLTFVNLIVGLEARLAKRLQRPVILVNEDAFGEDSSPFRDVAALADYVAKLSEAS